MACGLFGKKVDGDVDLALGAEDPPYVTDLTCDPLTDPSGERQDLCETTGGDSGAMGVSGAAVQRARQMFQQRFSARLDRVDQVAWHRRASMP